MEPKYVYNEDPFFDELMNPSTDSKAPKTPVKRKKRLNKRIIIILAASLAIICVVIGLTRFFRDRQYGAKTMEEAVDIYMQCRMDRVYGDKMFKVVMPPDVNRKYNSKRTAEELMDEIATRKGWHASQTNITSYNIGYVRDYDISIFGRGSIDFYIYDFFNAEYDISFSEVKSVYIEIERNGAPAIALSLYAYKHKGRWYIVESLIMN